MERLFGSLGPLLLAAPVRGRLEVAPLSIRDWLSQPSGSVFVVLMLALVVGGGIQGFRVLKSRRAVSRIAGGDPEITAIEEAAAAGRAGLVDLFRLLAHPTNPEIRNAAGMALCRLWKADELVAEEEMAILVRGRSVIWHARRKYPRNLDQPVTISVDFGVPFLDGGTNSVRSDNLLWSFRIAGTRQVSTEQFSPWQSSPTRAVIELRPDHFVSNGPFRLVLFVKARTEKLTSNWEMDFPQVPFAFEFDPILRLDALLGSHDEIREQAMNESLGLQVEKGPQEHRTFQPLTIDHAIGDRLLLTCGQPLPSDLAHRVHLEIEGQNLRLPAGKIVMSASRSPFPDHPIVIESSGSSTLDSPPQDLRLRVRAVMTPDAALAWSDPEIRSVWPGTITTSWREITLFRR